MKDIVLMAINAKYIHTNLAVRSLKAQLANFDVAILEMSINDSIHQMIERLLHLDAQRVGFSCTIWNMELVLKVAEVVKKSKPSVQIIFGGPEVSFDGATILREHPFCDFIIQGEGEESLRRLLEENGGALDSIPGLCYRQGAIGTFQNPEAPPLDLNGLTFPYAQSDFSDMKQKIIYYETMRGCPFSCSYCLSSTQQGLKMLSLSRVFKELDFFIHAGIKQVKLVDRTFNCDQSRAKAIFSHLIERGGNTNFHFEMTGDLLDDEMLDILQHAPKGLIQFEMGIQTTHPRTMDAIDRKSDLTKTEKNVKRLLAIKTIHIHLDLIAGLPFETYEIFKSSFNQVLSLAPDMLQLGFLKCLKGTKIRSESEKYGMTYASFPPYEIISNNDISASELSRLKQIETLVDRYYNSHAFKHTLTFLFTSGFFKTPFDFFEQFSNYWKAQGHFYVGKSKEQLYLILMDFLDVCQKHVTMDEWVRFDFLRTGHSHLPEKMTDRTPTKEAIFEFLKDETHVKNYLPQFSDDAPKKIFKHVKYQFFSPFFAREFLGENVNAAEEVLFVFYEGNYRLIS